MFISNIFLYNRKKIFLIENRILKKIISFIGQSTLWIYLWHIVIIYGILLLEKKSMVLNWKLLFVSTIVISCSIVYIQNFILDKLVVFFPNKKRIIQVLLKG